MVILRGYQFSVYNRIARIALHEKGVAYETEEIDPFQTDVPLDHLRRHPFGRVPVLSHAGFDIYETTAICRYIEAAFEGPRLLPSGAKALGRVAQVISIVDCYGYRPLVRQVFAHRVFRPSVGEDSDETEISKGLEASFPVLGALNVLAMEGNVLDGQNFTLADCHLAPMIAYFVQAAEGANALKSHSALADWWAYAADRRSVEETDPGLPSS
ncbi:glutathione S-transferase family protein [Nitratireductor sp. ZSWI3]|uniref:glutathione S-transferase family protein n=1 Tax=Nitratireductor sp. ZSWI3 TaxID=2966359 RepID=UPI00214F72E8|nr:glutathione S-transferase family protein [Nitratireductor sp. ZSWI3]MCR4267036.1 glutathione S-transferase family protein [Nitratireductor sp. ZSWI3]